jgi:hypothetical protein
MSLIVASFLEIPTKSKEQSCFGFKNFEMECFIFSFNFGESFLKYFLREFFKIFFPSVNYSIIKPESITIAKFNNLSKEVSKFFK